MKFENHGCSSFTEYVIRMDLDATVDINFKRVNLNFQKAEKYPNSATNFFHFGISEYKGPTSVI